MAGFGFWKNSVTELRRIMMGIPERLQEAILCLSEVSSVSCLEEGFRNSLCLTLSNVSDALVYVLAFDDQGLISSQGVVHTLPKEGLAWEAVQRRQRLTVRGLDAADPVSGLLVSGTEPLESSFRKVVCSPVIDNQTNKVVAVYAVVCDNLLQEDYQHLSFLEKQFLVCYRRLRFGISSSAPHWSDDMPQNKMSNQDAAILKLCADLYDTEAESLQLKVLQYLIDQTHSESGFLLLVDTERQEMFCQVVCGKVLEEEIRFPINQNSFATMMKNKTSFSLDEVESANMKVLRRYIDCEVTSSICIPVVCRISNEVMAVTCLINKRGSSCDRFTESDEQIVCHCFTYTAPVLHSTIAVQNERKIKNQTQVLLQVARNLFTHLDDLTKLLSEIMQEARNLTKAERCSVFLLDKESNELIAKVFDGDIRNNKQISSEVRIPATQGIAGHVATTGELLNIDDTYSHPLFYRGVDDATGFRTRNILCFPIKDEKGEVIGVAQLCNKINGIRFTAFDEHIAQAFSVYCCISIVHSLLYKKVIDTQHRSKLSNELMIYHMQVSNEEVIALVSAAIPPPSFFLQDIQLFSCKPREIGYENSARAVLSMFEDLGFISRHRIRIDCLARFVLMVRKGYRDPPYHNWLHAFAVVHFCYLLYKNTNVLKHLDDVEALSLFVSCLCHDIDHRGTTNSFQVASGSVLAALYSSEGSVLERHHFAQTMCILNTEGCNIFENLSKEGYFRALDQMRDIILATDLAQHLRKVKDLERLAEDGFDANDRQHKQLLLCLLMTASDLSDQTKSFANSKTIAELIYREFFSQGDMEKGIGRDPLEMMDRDKAVIPDLQVGFLDSVALPVYRIVAKLYPATSEVLEAAENNRKMWALLNHKLLQQKLPRNMDMFRCNVDFDI